MKEKNNNDTRNNNSDMDKSIYNGWVKIFSLPKYITHFLILETRYLFPMTRYFIGNLSTRKLNRLIMNNKKLCTDLI